MYGVGRKKAQKPTPQDIEIVCVQSFGDIRTKNYRPFIVSQEGPREGLYTERRASRETLDLLQSWYKTSQRDWIQAFEELPDIESTRSTTPPWLKETGIAEYLSRQSLSKAVLRALVQAPIHSKSACNPR